MKAKKKSRTIVLMIGLLIFTVLVCSSYYTFFANNGKNNPFSSTVNATDSFDDDLYLHQTAAENIVIDDLTGMGYVNNELIVTVKDTVNEDDIEDAISSKGAHIVGFNKYLNSYQVQFDESYSAEELEALRQEFSDMDLFEKTKVNLAFELVDNAIITPNDSKWKGKWEADPDGVNWGAEAIHAPEMWGENDILDCDPVNVGVLDNQFYTEHEDLSFVSTFLNEFSDGDDGEAHGNYVHGTHVAGTIAACFNNGKGIAGIAPQVNLYGASMLGLANRSVKTNDSKITVNELEAGLTYLICIKECKVVNFSYGWGDKRVAEEIVDTLIYFMEHENSDFLIVCSAGNGGDDKVPDDAINNSALTLITNSAIKNRIIVVGAAKLLDDGSIKVAEYSNYGSRVDLIAPGSKIYSTVYQPINLLAGAFSHNGYDELSGTSMAAPHVSGVAAAIWSLNPDLTGPEVKNILCGSASGSYGYEDSDKYPDTYRMLDACEAASEAKNSYSMNSGGIEIYADLTEKFIFTSGAGAWETEIQIMPDGTFTGEYHDSDMGDTGTDYPNGTRYECFFNGKFTPAQKINDYEYYMEIYYLNTEGIVGEEKIVDGVKVITADPYGFEYAGVFKLYLPGISTADLPRKYLGWVSLPNAWMDQVPAELPFYGLYNAVGEEGFFSETVSPSPAATESEPITAVENWDVPYAPLLEKYREFVLQYDTFIAADEWLDFEDWEAPWSTIGYQYPTQNPLENFGYAYKDIDNNGTAELILLRKADLFIYAIFTFAGGEPTLLGSYWERNYCTLDDSAFIYENGSGGAWDSSTNVYQIAADGKSLELMQTVGCESVYESEIRLDDPGYYITTGTEKEKVTREEANQVWSKYPDNNDNCGLLFIPIITPSTTPGGTQPNETSSNMQILTGQFQGIEWGDFMHISIKGDDGLDYSFFVLQSTDIDLETLEIGQNVRVTWQNSDAQLGEPFGIQNVDQLIDIELISPQ